MLERKRHWRALLAGLLLSFAAGLSYANGPHGPNAAPQPSPQASQASQANVAAASGAESLEQLDLRIAELENQMALAQAEVDRVNQERAELLARLDDLDAQIVLARQLITSQQQQISALQANLAAEAEQRARLEADQAQAAAAAAEAEAAAAAAEAVAEPEGALFNPVVVAIGLALIILTLFAVRMLRQDRDEERSQARGPQRERVNVDPPRVAKRATPDSKTAEPVVPRPQTTPAAGDRDDFAGETFSIEPQADPADPIALDEEAGAGAGAEQESVRDDSGPGPDPDLNKAREDDGPDDDDTYVIELDNGDEEEIAERLNLAYSFHRMGDTDQARRILEQVIRVGNESQVSEARQLLAIIHDLD